MKTITRTAAILALMLLAGFANLALAQRPYRLSEGDLRGLMSRLERDSDQFRQSIDHSLDRSRLDGSRAEDRINDFVKAFEQATDRLKDRFDDDRSASATVQEVLDRGAAIDRFITPEEFDAYGRAAYAKGFLLVASSPLTRSSYHAAEDFARLKALRQAALNA